MSTRRSIVFWEIRRWRVEFHLYREVLDRQVHAELVVGRRSPLLELSLGRRTWNVALWRYRHSLSWRQRRLVRRQDRQRLRGRLR